MRDVSVPFHDREGIARQRAGKNVDVREHRAESAGDDGGARGGRTQRAGFGITAYSSGNVTASEKGFAGQSAHNAMRNRVHGASYFVSSRSDYRCARGLAVSLLTGSNGDGQRLGGLRRGEHMALPVENTAGLDDQAWGVDLTRDHALGLYLNPALCENDSIEFSGNHHVISFDLPLYPRAFAENEAMRGDHVALHMGVDAEYAGGLERALKFDAPVEEACEFVLLRVFVAPFGSPLHDVPPREIEIVSKYNSLPER
jgi:hypothetical protein